MLVVLHEFTIEVTHVIEFREIERLAHITHLVNDVALVAQLYDERICVLSQQFHVIECGLEHIVVEVVYDVFGHVQNGEPDEERRLHLRTGVFNLIPIRFSEYMVVPAIISYPCFSMIASRSFHVLANFTFIRFNPVINGQLELEFAIQRYDSGYQILKHKH